VHFLDGHHHSTGSWLTLREIFSWIHFSCISHTAIKNCIEFTWAITKTNSFKHNLNLISWSNSCKINLWNSDIQESCREHNINRFGLISIVLVICYRLQFLRRNISSYAGYAECAIRVLWSSDNVARTWSRASAKIIVRHDFFGSWLAWNTFGGIPLCVIF